ncbi:hypothetical protein [Cryobacterium sp.]|uniref:hypothetical protein n=1 Tax=Cryobacterium sp. TaxID=1926290 RepID=UPI002626A10A|nr:hypothetical protein [Cryobacterium sp.]MCU1447456.1 hypothetical protein [Cryobacterium sp.]
MDLILILILIPILVLSLLLYSISARDSLARPGLFVVLQLVLVIVTLGLNLLLLVNLVRTAWLTTGFLRAKRPFAALENWQTRYLPVYGGGALVVVVIFPLAFAFA